MIRAELVLVPRLSTEHQIADVLGSRTNHVVHPACSWPSLAAQPGRRKIARAERGR